MALFKSRKKKVDEPRAATSPAESIEVMRRRARHRLIGAVVLVLVGVVGFPLLFDTQPRPVAVDIPIEIPDRNKAQPLPLPPQSSVATGKVTQQAAPAPAAPAAPVAQAQPAPPPVAAAKPDKAKEAESHVAAVEAKPAKPEPAAEKKAQAKPEPKAEPKAEPKPVAKAEASDDGAKARALLNGKTVDTAAAGGRYVVQVGAFADASKARDARLRVERAGLKTYTNVAETKGGRRIRVRAGPFSSRAEADKAAEKIKGLDLPAAILTL